MKVSNQFARPLEVESLCGDANKAKQMIEWNPQILAPKLAQIMVDADLARDSFLF